MPEHDDIKFFDEQKKQENQLIDQRTNWGLIANSFLIISSAIAGNGDSANTIFFLYIIPIVGCVISLAAFLLIHAANKQLEYLKEHWRRIQNWDDLIEEQKKQIIRPFGNKSASIFGSKPTYVIFIALFVGWSVFLLTNIGQRFSFC